MCEVEGIRTLFITTGSRNAGRVVLRGDKNSPLDGPEAYRVRQEKPVVGRHECENA